MFVSGDIFRNGLGLSKDQAYGLLVDIGMCESHGKSAPLQAKGIEVVLVGGHGCGNGRVCF